ncbi:MAG: SUF system NifU family Fe-S cluster assembly protein [Myxococcaceae bacterium]|nr:SUF system NifU family Fe-S cluster assembly protein [Myxococcaceae bacterium]MBH2006172.1 SUF system NifU family Fe-S cluster assembly protein [Myxococcaceae bacterium]
MLDDLYQELILDHSRHPHHYGDLPGSTHSAHGHNPLCGDELFVYLVIENARIQNIRFQGEGCAISKASASLMTDELIGKTLQEARILFQEFHELLTQEKDQFDHLVKAQALRGVREFPVRVKCATLAWHTFEAALKEQAAEITTE